MTRRGALKGIKWSYKVVRSVILTAIVLAVFFFISFYVSLAIPPVQNFLKEKIQDELSAYLGSPVTIGSLSIRPVNELIIEDTRVYDLDGKECLYINRLGSGINLWGLLFNGGIEVTYVELLNFKANLYQVAPDSPLNIDFIIQAVSPKDKNKPPRKFDLKIHNIVIRGGEIRFDKLWEPEKGDNLLDFNHICVTRFSADITIPRLSNDLTEIDLRRLSFNEKSGLQIKDIAGLLSFSGNMLGAERLTVRLPQTEINFDPFILPLGIFNRGGNDTAEELFISISNSRVTPSNLAAFLPVLADFDFTLPLEATFRVGDKNISVDRLNLGSPSEFEVTLSVVAENYRKGELLNVTLSNLELLLTPAFVTRVLHSIPRVVPNENIIGLINSLGNIDITVSGNYSNADRNLKLNTELAFAQGKMLVSGEAGLIDDGIEGKLGLELPSFVNNGTIPYFPIDEMNGTRLNFTGTLNTKEIKSSHGELGFEVSEISLKNRQITGIHGELLKEGNSFTALLDVDSENLNGDLTAEVILDGENTEWFLDVNLKDFDTYSSLLAESSSTGYEFSGKVKVEAAGNSMENMRGTLTLNDFEAINNQGKILSVRDLILMLNSNPDYPNSLTISSRMVDFNMTGSYNLLRIPAMAVKALSEVCPGLISPTNSNSDCGEGKFELVVKNANPLIEFFGLPVFPLDEMEVKGYFNSVSDIVEVATEIPYIQQGTNKLITGTYLDLRINGGESKIAVNSGMVYPTKKGLLKIDLSLVGLNGQYDIDIDLNRGRNVAFTGQLGMLLNLAKDELTGEPMITLEWRPSSLQLNEAIWKMEESEIVYTKGFLSVRDFCLRHDNQFVTISGTSGETDDGKIIVSLSEINLDYIFDTLNINHVTFGGQATGEISASKIFSPNPIVKTERLFAKNLSYNGSLLGDADLRGRLDLPEKKIEIGALISERERMVAEAEGGVWFGRDSLAFHFMADSVNVGFMQPFMSAFSSEITGRASGDITLYGTFSDMDITGEIEAHGVSVLIDYINARYEGSDTVTLTPGKIEIPNMVMRDKFGNTAIVNGVVEHTYFHEPTFNFKVTEMDHLLVYDTNAGINPFWYGTLFASGNGEITGRPGIVRIAADVETEGGSDFTFVLSDQQEAVRSDFLTFSDRRKEYQESQLPKDTVPDFLKKFSDTHNGAEQETSDVFVMDFRVSVTDDVRFNLIMDPVAGDKIVAYGEGAMNLTYSSLTDELKIYGKYVLDKGTYNFSLQDIILKEFTIKPGSSIAFTGDPYTGILNITAAYRVNTSLTELDQSFANDRELNRTSVPVEALLKVSGVLTSPTIDFDIELPTVTEETAQKVRSIISTEDMMSRQVLYLVALNKFYPPEYMTTSNSGGEWASIASSTISSQIQNMIGQITDKFTLAPSIRSDKGDFSDIEVDLALSSQLFNNRLLINGNLGYRDPSNSSTTFVGDFDLEYLLNKKGTWRLKAYNHFNDQNYYLKSALTTQGMGIVWRKDFGLPRKPEPEPSEFLEEVLGGD